MSQPQAIANEVDSAALEALAEAKASRFRGARVVVAAFVGDRLLAKEELTSQYALRRLAERLRSLGFDQRGPNRSCPDCDAVFARSD